MTPAPDCVAVGDPVVIHHDKMRVTSLGGPPRYNVYARDRYTRRETIVLAAELAWDPVPALWRVACPGCPHCEQPNAQELYELERQRE